MGVNLSKGQTVSLVKQGGGSLSQVRMGLGWDAMKKKGMFGGMKEVSVDLDASATADLRRPAGAGDRLLRQSAVQGQLADAHR